MKISLLWTKNWRARSNRDELNNTESWFREGALVNLPNQWAINYCEGRDMHSGVLPFVSQAKDGSGACWGTKRRHSIFPRPSRQKQSHYSYVRHSFEHFFPRRILRTIKKPLKFRKCLSGWMTDLKRGSADFITFKVKVIKRIPFNI